MDTWNVRFGDQIEAVLCNNDTMAMGAVESLKTAGAFDDGKGPAYMESTESRMYGT